jgi:two-component system NtrC family sensor kinase
MAQQSSLTILVIDDDPSIVSALSRLLQRDGHTVETADNGQQALERLREHPYDLILCDLRMPDLDGPAFYDILTRQSPSMCPRIIFLTGDTLNLESQAFLERSGRLWMPKPCNAAEVRRIIAQVMRMR